MEYEGAALPGESSRERSKLVRLSDGASPEEPVHPLIPGTRVGAWRVKAWRGQGAYGAVYRAVRRGWRRSGPVALKVALLPWDGRLAREAELLSRLSHPSIPRLLERGGLKPFSGAEYPFIVMEWVEGTPLYAWAEQHAPSGKQVCRGLARLAEAATNERVPRRPAEPQPAVEVPPPNVPAPESGSERPQRAKPPAWEWAWEPWLALAAAGAVAVLLAVLAWHSQPVSVLPGPVFVNAPGASDSQAPDAGTAAVGDTSPTKPQASTPPPTEKKPLAQEPLPEPSPDQARPDKRGKCPGSRQVPINGGCWVQSSMPTEECVENGGVLFQGKCYSPARAPPKKPPPTSSPPEER
jgi:hypothetical protein